MGLLRACLSEPKEVAREKIILRYERSNGDYRSDGRSQVHTELPPLMGPIWFLRNAFQIRFRIVQSTFREHPKFGHPLSRPYEFLGQIDYFPTHSDAAILGKCQLDNYGKSTVLSRSTSQLADFWKQILANLRVFNRSRNRRRVSSVFGLRCCTVCGVIKATRPGGKHL